MPLSRSVAAMIIVSPMTWGTGVVCQDYPSKPLRIVTSEVGGSNDFVSRLIAQGLTGSLGQQVIVENRAGASGAIAMQTVAKAPPDGYTLLLYSGTGWIVPLMQNTSYDVVRDFLPVTLTTRQPNILVVHPSLPVRSVKDLIVLGKARPGELNYASSSIGSSNHLAAELFKAMAGVSMVRISYKGTATAYNDLMGGQVQLMFAVAGGVTPHINSGRLRAVAVTSADSSTLAPGLPTIAASGLPGYESVAMHAVFAPIKTPAPLVSRLNQEIVRFLRTADAKEKLLNIGVEVVGSSPEQLAATIKSEVARMGKVIKHAGIRAE